MAKLSKAEIELMNKLVFTKHVYGLPVAEGVDTDIYYDDDGFTISSGNMTFGLGYDVVSDICIKTDVEISKQYVSSAGGAVGGAMMFGPIGSVIGGRVQARNTSVEKKYIIITYIKNSKFNYLCFELMTFGRICRGNFRCDELNRMVKNKIKAHSQGMVYSLTDEIKPKMKNVVSTYKANTELIGKAQAAQRRGVELIQKQARDSDKCIIFVAIMIFLAIVIAMVLAVATNNLDKLQTASLYLG